MLTRERRLDLLAPVQESLPMNQQQQELHSNHDQDQVVQDRVLQDSPRDNIEPIVESDETRERQPDTLAIVQEPSPINQQQELYSHHDQAQAVQDRVSQHSSRGNIEVIAKTDETYMYSHETESLEEWSIAFNVFLNGIVSIHLLD